MAGTDAQSEATVLPDDEGVAARVVALRARHADGRMELLGSSTEDPVLLDPGLPLERRRDNFDAKMAFPVRSGSRMALMLRRFTNHLQGNG